MSGVEYVAAFGGITPRGMMGHGKTAIPKPATSSVTRGRNRGQPTSYGWVAGVNPLAPLSGITNNIMGQKGIRCSLQWAEMTRRCIESQVARFNSANLKLHF